ncbi:MAG: hypothetical protein ABIJ56_19800 [Pseudomonadota bacterium]
MKPGTDSFNMVLDQEYSCFKQAVLPGAEYMSASCKVPEIKGRLIHEIMDGALLLMDLEKELTGWQAGGKFATLGAA